MVVAFPAVKVSWDLFDWGLMIFAAALGCVIIGAILGWIVSGNGGQLSGEGREQCCGTTALGTDKKH
jgi:hypothetical protein